MELSDQQMLRYMKITFDRRSATSPSRERRIPRILSISDSASRFCLDVSSNAFQTQGLSSEYFLDSFDSM